MAVNYLSSPYDNARVIEYDDGSFIVESMDIGNTVESTSTYTVKDGDTLQSIAHAMYGDSGLWYLLAEANSIHNPFDILEFYPGQLLKVP